MKEVCLLAEYGKLHIGESRSGLIYPDQMVTGATHVGHSKPNPGPSFKEVFSVSGSLLELPQDQSPKFFQMGYFS